MPSLTLEMCQRATPFNKHVWFHVSEKVSVSSFLFSDTLLTNDSKPTFLPIEVCFPRSVLEYSFEQNT